MSLVLQMWLFGGLGAGLLAVLAFSWHNHRDWARSHAALKEELFQHQLHVAEHFATVAASVLMEKRMVDALDDIKETLRRQDDKLDRLFREKGRP